MKRCIQNELLSWKDSKTRKPLILRGARQVGKTHAVREFAKAHFKQFIEINFELQPQFKALFTTLDAVEIVRNLSLNLGVTFTPGTTLLFLDEIQECPQAISALRYFYEKMPGLHVIGAGSLLEFVLAAADFKMPVGRVEYLYMQPLSFGEFLIAAGQQQLKDHLDTLTHKTSINATIHDKLLSLFKNYLLIGGMPESVAVHLGDPAGTEFQNTQLALLQTYRDDFGKYASRAKQPHLQKIFNTAPGKVGQPYKYSQIDRETPSRELKQALELITQAGVITKVMATSGHGLPFLKDANERKFKIIFLDVGLMQRACGLSGEIALAKDFLVINSGAVAEQFVGQELISCRNPRETPELFFWCREKKGGQAEVDYLAVLNTKVIPVEVKSGKAGTLKSLNVFIDEHKSPFGIRFSQLPLSFYDRVLSIPIYAVAQMQRIAQELL